LAWFLYLVLHPEVWFMWFGEPLEMMGVPWPLIEVGAHVARGLILGFLGGLVTGVAIRWADDAFARSRVMWVGILWALVWAAGTAIPAALQTFGLLPDMPPLFWVLRDGAVGLVGGFLTAASLRGVSSFGVAFGWGLGGALRRFGVSRISVGSDK